MQMAKEIEHYHRRKGDIIMRIITPVLKNLQLEVEKIGKEVKFILFS